MSPARRVADGLPDFPWDSLAAAKATAKAHPAGIVDLSVGTPVDPVPDFIADELRAAAQRWAGYPTVWGTASLRSAILSYLADRWQASGLDEPNVLPVMGSKEFVAALPSQLGLGADDVVVIPKVAYPTYEVGALLAGCRIVRCDDPAALNESPSLIWLNYPANPHGAIADIELLRAWVAVARQHDAVLASDECYGEFGWDAEPISVLDPRVHDADSKNIIAIHSMSKRSNMAGYRAAFAAGCKGVLGGLLELRKHAGAMVPGPVQDAMSVALSDQTHVEAQRARYLRRRDILRSALEQAGFRIEHSEGSLYLWATRDEDGRDSVQWLADRGILVAPGDFYGNDSAQFVRVALTATDERVESAADRLRQ